MSDALRHTLRSIELPGGDTMTRLEIHPDGEWVRFEDYQAALQRAEALHCGWQPGDGPCKRGESLCAYCELHLEVTQLRADKRRLDWLCEMAEKFYVDIHSECTGPDANVWCVLCWGDDERTDAAGVPAPDGPYSEKVATLRAAIDAAMQADGDGEDTP